MFFYVWGASIDWAHQNNSFNMHLSYPGASILCLHILSSLGLTIGSGCSLRASRRQVFFSVLSALRATGSHWRDAVADDCGILGYWCGRRYCISHPNLCTFPRPPKAQWGCLPLSHSSCAHMSLRSASSCLLIPGESWLTPATVPPAVHAPPLSLHTETHTR